MKSCLSLIVPALWVINGNRAANILAILPLPFKSHFYCNDAIMNTLSDAGHEITLFTSFPKEASSKNYSKIINVSTDSETVINQAPFAYNAHRKMTTLKIMEVLSILEKPFCDRVFKTKEYQDMLNSNNFKFDVIFIEIHAFHHCFLPLAKKTGVPVIGITTFKSWYLSDRAIGNVIHPANVPYEFNFDWKFNRFYQRFTNYWNYIEAEYVWQFYTRPLLEKFIHNNENQLKQYSGFLDIQPSLIFQNSHYSILPRPMNPNVIEIGGLQISPAKPLPENILKFIEEAENGVILFTFGSLVRTSSLPSSIRDVFINVFATIPQRVIWKYEEKIENLPKNVMIMEWLPQRDILEHPKVKAFFSHCGQGGMYEAIHTATPVIACPLRIDQFTNAAILENLEVAVEIDINSISEESLTTAINLIVNDIKYYDNMEKLSKAFNDRPMTLQQSVVYWTEYVIKHKGAFNLKPPSSQLNWFQYFLLDILCVVVTSLICISFATYFLITRVILVLKSIFHRLCIIKKNKSD